jgi:hypothetical protein
MPTINIEVNCEIEIPKITGTFDFEKKELSRNDIQKFVAGELGEFYLELLAPDDGVYMELCAEKLAMKKKGAVFEVIYSNNIVKAKISGTFKVNAYSFVIPKLKSNPDSIYVAGLYCGSWPPYGGEIKGFDKSKKHFPVLARLV